MSMMGLFKAILLTQLFYAFAITILVYSLAGTLQTENFLDSFSSASFDLNEVSDEIQTTMERQTQIPVVDIGALVLFSGNILLDLLTNFVFALPQMVTLLINGIMMLMPIDKDLTVIIQTFATVTFFIMYFIGLLQLLTNVRSGRII